MTGKQRYGWIRGLPDKRDFKYKVGVTGAKVQELPESVDLRTTGLLPPVFSQGSLGSCTANALGAMFFFVDKKATGLSILPSRLFTYYNTRAREGTVPLDNGAMIVSGIKSLVEDGACLEYQWPYDVSRFTQKPPSICYTNAQRHQSTIYRRVSHAPEDLMGCLAEGYPVTVGLALYTSFESDLVARTGEVPMPSILRERLIGGHAVLIVGYTKTHYIVMNSWGKDWGQDGFFTIPKAYVQDPELGDDYWMVHAVEKAE